MSDHPNLAARRAAREAGMVPVVLSKKTAQALREWDEGRFTDGNERLKRRVTELFIEDALGAVLREK